MARRKQVTRKQRNEIQSAVDEVNKERAALLDGIVGTRQLQEEEVLFSSSMMDSMKLVKPPYDPQKLSKICESSGILPQCIEAMQQNVDGFGYELQYTGVAGREKDKEVLAEKDNLKHFFDKVNETESFRTVREKVRRDLETIGNGYIEVIRFKDDTIATMYHADGKTMRLQAIQPEPIPITVPLFRSGKLREVTINRKFRRYVTVLSKYKRKVRWYKQYGDPRSMDADTGDYAKGKTKAKNEASEILHMKIGNDAYGVPRWSGQVLPILGMGAADFVNWDLFDNQVVPPLAILLSGGSLTTESIRDVKKILIQKRGVENFNKVLILEAQSEGSVSDKTAVRVELKELSQARKEDAMFTQYTEKGEHRVRGSFRLPPLYVGRADAYSKSTADSSRMIAEEQIFVPERDAFDETVNVLVMPELGGVNWKYVSKGPRLIMGTEMVDGFKEFSKSGVFTINEGIRVANRLLNMDITQYEEDWANFPIPIVLELAKMGFLKGIDSISSAASELGSIIQTKTVDTPKDVAKVYTMLSNMRSILREAADARVEIEEEIGDAVYTGEERREAV